MDSMPSVTDLVADRYEVSGVLGEGGTGVVYDARRLEDGAAVALKIMHTELAGDQQIRGRFQREAAILRRLEGPHVCPILDSGEIASGGGKTLLYLALPKIDGASLEQVMKDEGPLPVDRALDVMLEVCDALQSAHAQGVIHRDLKPANVILERGERVVVVDFGMSKIVTGTGTGTTNLTTHNMVFGTPEYMSPEQARGDELDARCDVYAAGVMLYELLTGAPPFTGPTPLTVLTAHLTSELEPPSKRAPEGRITDAIERVVMRALARDRDARYPSASALAAAIRRARAEPDGVEARNPEALTGPPSGTDAFAVTMPGSPPDAFPRSRAVIDPDAAPMAATVASEPPPRMRSGVSSAPPPTNEASSRAAAPKAGSSDESARTWVLLWVLAGIASIGLGVYLALR